jgi:hypothetical protein
MFFLWPEKKFVHMSVKLQLSCTKGKRNIYCWNKWVCFNGLVLCTYRRKQVRQVVQSIRCKAIGNWILAALQYQQEE